MPKRKARKLSGDSILQDCNITSASNMDTEVSYPSDKTFEKYIENCDVSYYDLNQSPSREHMHKLVEDSQVIDSSEASFKVPFSTKNVRNCRPSLFDSVLNDSEPNTPESSKKSEPFKRKCPGKEVSFSISSSNGTADSNVSVRKEPKFVRKQITRSKAHAENNIFDSDLDESIDKSKLSSREATHSSQVQSRKSTIVNYKNKKIDANNSGMFESDLESSDMTRNILNLDNNIEPVDECNGTSHKNITQRKKKEKARCLPKFLARSKTTIGQVFGNNTFDNIVNGSSNDISSESNTELQSSLSRREVLLAERKNSTNDVTNNLSSSKSPRLPFVKTKNICDEVNADFFESDLEASDISLHCTNHTTDNIINNNSSNAKSLSRLPFVKEKNHVEEVNSGIFGSDLEVSNTSLQCTYRDESQCNGIDSEKEVGNVSLSNVENSNDCNIQDSNKSQDFASSPMVAEDNSTEGNINFSLIAGSSTSVSVNDTEPNKELLNSIESSRAFHYLDVNRSQEVVPNNLILGGNLIGGDCFSPQVSDKLLYDIGITLDVSQGSIRSNNNSHRSGASLVESICQVSKSKDEVNALNDNSEIGAKTIQIEESKNNTVSNCLSMKKSVPGKRVSFKNNYVIIDTTFESASANDCSVQQEENNSSTSLDSLVYESPLEGLNSESVFIDIHASRSRNTGSSVNSNSEHQLIYSNDNNGSVENEDVSENIQIMEHSNVDESESDHEDEENTEGSPVYASRSRNTGSSVHSNSEHQLIYSSDNNGSVENEDVSENIQITEHSNVDESESDHEDEENTEGSPVHASRSRNTGSSVPSNSEHQLIYSNNNNGSVESEDVSENIQITEHSNVDESESDHEDEEDTEGSPFNADIDDEYENGENISTNHGDNDYSTILRSNINISDDGNKENTETNPGDVDEGDINYSSNEIFANNSDAFYSLHSNFIGSVERPFEGGNEQSEKYTTGNVSYNDENGEDYNSPINNLSTQDPDKSSSQVNINVYKQYDSFLKNVHVKKHPIPHTAQPKQADAISFKKPYPKKSRKSRTRNILDKIPFSELKTKKRHASEANREQALHDEIEESLRKRQKPQPINTKLNNGKLKRPKKWVSSSLYDFIINKLKPKYGVNSRVQAEKLVVHLVGQVDKVLKIQDLSFYSVVEEMKLKLAGLRVIQTHFDFRELIIKHFDAPFSQKVYPFSGDVWNPFEPKNMFEVIPIED